MKFGLALSGGGFRASFFHLGVLAYLADIGWLKNLRYLSTVSGGSIVGAAYYLKVMQLLEQRHPRHPRPSDAAYVTIVQELIALFRDGVKQNLRMRTLLDPQKIVKMFRDDYSRSDRISELYGKYFYQRIWKDMGKTLDEGGIPLHQIKISPPGGPPKDIEAYNDQAEFKIPVLMINATTLNGGHNWQFTGSYVGEPPQRLMPVPTGPEAVDTNRVFQQLRFDDPAHPPKVKAKLEELTLGDAVAASACVPVLFQPMAIHDLYGPDIVMQLVDGGVFDNQGLQALQGRGATDVICSDASLQLDDDDTPSVKMFNVLLKTNDILMDVLREEELAGFLRSGASSKLLHWNQHPTSQDPHGIPRPSPGMVKLLSHIRTDLDSFHDREAFSLMYTGYFFCRERVQQWTTPAQTQGWAFWAITYEFESVNKQAYARLLSTLEVSHRMLFKVFKLRDPLAWVSGGALAVVVVALLMALILKSWDTPLTLSTYAPSWLLWPFQTVGMLIATILLGAIGLALYRNGDVRHMMKSIPWVRKTRDGVFRLLSHPPFVWPLAFVVLLFVSIPVWIHLKWFDRRYLKLGEVATRSQR